MKKCCCPEAPEPVDTYSRVAWIADGLTPQSSGATNGELNGSGVGGAFAVSLDNVTPGNVVEIDYNLSWIVIPGDAGTYRWSMQAVAVISFSANAIPPFPASYVKIDQSRSYAGDEVTVVTPGTASATVLSGKGAVVVPPGATKATVALIYTEADDAPSGNVYSAGQIRLTEYAAIQSPNALPFTTSAI
jgi:hypothetical protein